MLLSLHFLTSFVLFTFAHLFNSRDNGLHLGLTIPVLFLLRLTLTRLSKKPLCFGEQIFVVLSRRVGASIVQELLVQSYGLLAVFPTKPMRTF